MDRATDQGFSTGAYKGIDQLVFRVGIADFQIDAVIGGGQRLHVLREHSLAPTDFEGKHADRAGLRPLGTFPGEGADFDAGFDFIQGFQLVAQVARSGELIGAGLADFDGSGADDDTVSQFQFGNFQLEGIAIAEGVAGEDRDATKPRMTSPPSTPGMTARANAGVSVLSERTSIHKQPKM